MVTSSMETRHLRKRRWKSSPNKTPRTELDFGQRTPSPKKRRQNENVRSETVDDEQESFTIKSFYGKREKMHFPHSPGRRKKVGQVLNKLSDDNTESESETKSSYVIKRSTFQFHSSDSADTDSDYKPVSKTGSAKKYALKKVPLDITVKNKEPKTPKMNTRNKKFLSNSTSKIANRPVLTEMEPQLQTPVTGKKFFKTRSPASADKCIGGIIVRKGFNLQFLANKNGKASQTPKSSNKKPKAKTEKPTPKGVTVKSLKKTMAVEDGVIYFEDEKDGKPELEVDGDKHSVSESDTVINNKEADSEKDTGNITSATDNETVDHMDISEKKETEGLVEKTGTLTDKDFNDSAIDTANSEDLFSNVSDHSGPVIRDKLNINEATELSDQSGHELRDRLDDEINVSDCSGPVVRQRAKDTTSSDIESERLESGQTTPSRGTPTNNVSPVSDSSSVIGGSQESPQLGKKLFPIFTKGMRTPQDGRKDSLRKLRSGSNSPGGSPLLRYIKSKDTKEQMIIDAGQKRYGVTHCGICGMVYSQAEPADETMHHKFHQGLLNALRFPGWKKEHVVQEFLNSGSRIVMVKAGDPAYATKKVEEINNIMGRELGFPEQSMMFSPKYKAFLYISSEKRIEGCCITEPISEGFPVLPGSQSQSPSPQKNPGQRPWYCSDKPKPAVVGISKIWVYGQSRKQGVASRLLECVRQWFEYGTVIPKEKVAFSDPTPDGKKLAEKYVGSPEFLVYKFQ